MLMKKIHRQPGAVDERAVDQPCGGGADTAKCAPDPQRLVPLRALSKGRGDDRQGGRSHDRRSGALEHAGRQQPRRRPGQPAQQRCSREDHDTCREHPLAPEQVSRSPSEQQQAAEAERVGAQHPLQALLRKVQAGPDRGQPHDRDRSIQEHDEKRAAQERRRPPAARIENGGRHAPGRCGRFHRQPSMVVSSCCGTIRRSDRPGGQ
jgi:hypothetical protein